VRRVLTLSGSTHKLNRVRRLRWGLLILSLLVVSPPIPKATSDPPPLPPPPPAPFPEARFLAVSSYAPYAGDTRLLATVSPNGDGYRDFVDFRFFLTSAARVTVHAQTALRTFQRVTQPQWFVRRRASRGWQTVRWRPSPELDSGTYVIILTLESGRHSFRYGRVTPGSVDPPGPVVRVLGVDAAFDRSSYAPGETAQLTIASDAGGLTVRVVDVAGSEMQSSVKQLDGPDVVEPRHYAWDANRNDAASVPVEIGDWRPGVYFAVIRDDAGDTGHAPLIVRAPAPHSRVAVLIPDQTWFAYDFYDGDRDGFPDSWYADGADVVTLARPFDHAGVPWQFGGQTWPFLRWLRLHNVDVDFLAEADAVQLGSSLADHYDLIVVPTHLEYVTEPEYDALQHYRDQGGDLIFLASNDVYWKVDVAGGSMHRAVRWRDLGRPEAALVGAQYAGSKTGDAAPYVIGDAGAAAWAFEGTGLSATDPFSVAGTEFDVTTAASPPGTQVLATVRTGTHRGEMTYYEMGAAKVFAPGTFFSGRVLQPAESRLLENVWNHSDAPDLPKAPNAVR
jgi:hypothetical protein